MPKQIFLDNYRGFSKTFVPLVDVNFMVGENSTGKTSFLDLIKILANPSLVMGPYFGAVEEARFGHFNEVVSAHSEDRSFFSIGTIEEVPGSKSSKDSSFVGTSFAGTLMTYKEDGGVPKLSRLTSCLGDSQIQVHIEGTQVFYRLERSSIFRNVPDACTAMLTWSNEHQMVSGEWETITRSSGVVGSHLPLYFMLHMALADKHKGTQVPLMIANFTGPLVYVAPIRTKPRRTYDEPHTPYSSEGSHTPYVIRRLLASNVEATKFEKFMRRIGKASGLFESIIIRRFGESDDAPFEVDAVVDEKALNLSWVGYGVSQSLPIIVELLDRPRGTWFAIQQPEVHLHPRAQAALGDLFFEVATQDKKRFVIETHSDFTIDRFRMKYRRHRGKLPSSQILFFERSNRKNVVTSLPINRDGDLPADQPDSYRKFFVREEMRLLGI